MRTILCLAACLWVNPTFAQTATPLNSVTHGNCYVFELENPITDERTVRMFCREPAIGNFILSLFATPQEVGVEVEGPLEHGDRLYIEVTLRFDRGTPETMVWIPSRRFARVWENPNPEHFDWVTQELRDATRVAIQLDQVIAVLPLTGAGDAIADFQSRRGRP